MKKIVAAINDTSHVLDVWLPTRVKLSDIPGLSIAISYKGKILYRNGFGYADKEKKTKTTENTLYHIASISKTFTAVAILQLVEQGKLKLDDKVSKHVERFKGKNKNGDLKNITIKQLLSNSSGIWRDGDTPHWVTGKFPRTLNLSTETLIFKPSSEFKYSNFGFSVLGEVIKSVTGLTYEDYVRKNIISVLNLKSTYPDYKNNIKNLATGYGKEVNGRKREKYGHYKTYAYISATGFISNALDLAKYVYYLSPKANESILKNKSKKKMMQPYKKTEGKARYCLGLDMDEVNKRKIYGHGGGFQGFATDMVFDPESEIGVAVLTNGTHSPAGSFTKWILQIIYNLLDNKNDYSLGKNANYNKYEGIYRNLWGDSVVVKAGKALVSFGLYTHSPLQGDNKRFLVPVSGNKFIAKGGSGFGSKGELVKFTKFKDGKFQVISFGPTPSKRTI